MHDSLNQLTGATVGSDVYAYTYDNGGNITAKTKNGVEVAYTYGNTEWKDLLTNYNGVDITYDTIGNPLNWINGEQFTWGGGRQLTGIVKGNDTISYTYNDNGIRTSKTVNGIRTDYYLNGTAIIMQKTGDNVIWYTYDENGNIAGMNYNGSDYWFYRNAQNDVIGIVDSSGAVVAKYTYDDWGKITAVTDGQGNDISANATHIANINPIRYRGYYYDTETGLYYINSRYYDAEIGRWINADDSEILNADFENIMQYNLFAYCFNNPVNMSDAIGTWPSWATKVVAAVAVVAVVAAVAAITVTTAGAGTAVAVIAVGAAKGAAIGLASGAAIGAATGAASHRISTGSWNGVGTATLNGMADGALSGAVTGAISGAAGSALKVGQAAKAWDASSKGGPWTNMSDHYKRHVLMEGKKAMTKNVITYTDDAVALWNKSNGVGKLMSSGSLRLKGTGVGGFYSKSGLIRSFFYQ